MSGEDVLALGASPNLYALELFLRVVLAVAIEPIQKAQCRALGTLQHRRAC